MPAAPVENGPAHEPDTSDVASSLVGVSEFGVVTMATDADSIIRACALSASLQLHQPAWPRCIITTPDAVVPDGWFHHVIRFEQPEPYANHFRYLNKLVHPFVLSPFTRTLFLDDDTLVIRPFQTVLEANFLGHQVALNTRKDQADEPRPGTNHLDASVVCQELATSHCWNTYGGGHMYFESISQFPELAADAIDIAVNQPELYERWSAQSIVSDELALLIAINQQHFEMPTIPDFVDALSLRLADSAHFSVRESTYRLPGRPWGEQIGDVAILHFCSSAKRSVTYARSIRQLTGMRQSFDMGWRGALRRVHHDALRLRRRLARGIPRGGTA